MMALAEFSTRWHSSRYSLGKGVLCAAKLKVSSIAVVARNRLNMARHP
jgi:hypothetical protein